MEPTNSGAWLSGQRERFLCGECKVGCKKNPLPNKGEDWRMGYGVPLVVEHKFLRVDESPDQIFVGFFGADLL